MTAIKERPILFSAPMVRAILEGRKTVTRRTLKMPHGLWETSATGELVPIPANCPYGKPGDRLYVRETWSDVNLQGAPGIAYRADDDIRDLMEDESFLDERGAFNYDDPRSKPYPFACWSEDLIAGTEGRWRPSIHMPRWVSRILLEVTAVRIERLQDIDEDQAQVEGIGDHEFHCREPYDQDGAPTCDCASISYEDSFQRLWESINGADSWAANPWVWVIEFKRVQP
ncbi:hypothetical protein POF45_26670 [Pseudomonas sp. 681]|uniref:Morphogenetic protein n=1 Tax=Pseudomonas fungipugnans TaxID=3024217 RepID=A0ABT6QVP1_9PSED|nr:hypothetical protein [Pseudomonas sp. 681]MDI2594980.1 hypothetical protein [Pseudomonas sp. 681]